jgi:hypothetical protein
MARKKTKNDLINKADAAFPQDAYVTWEDSNLDDKRNALKEASKGLDEFGLVDKTTANNSRYRLDFSNLVGDTSGRPGLTRSDYDYFRPEEAIPTHIKGIFFKADSIYNRVGLVKNVIDLMADFAVQGIKPVCKNKRTERFYRKWFKKVNGKDRSERFLNNLYRIGNVVINRQTAKISLKVAESMYRTSASPDLIINTEDSPQIEKREIPWKYTFIDPICVDVVGGALSSFVGDKTYAITLPAGLRKIINAPKNDAEKAIIDQLPPAIIEAAKSKKSYLLDPNKTLVYHYKKDDWKTWAYPIVYSIMDDINVIEKLKLADLAALDGAISNIRIFKLGSLEHMIAPTAAAANKLSSILQNNVGGGTMDLVWGPDIELIESKTSVHQFLGEGKYTPHLNSIYAGLGIPPTLTGTFGAAGTTNNFISLKTLTQRLQYGRDVLISFWEKEFELIQKAMDFKYAAKIEFDRMDLSNEDTEKALLIQLADRNVISDELLQSRFGFDAEMEKIRLNRESRDRSSDRMVKKAGPWHDPEFENALKKISLQTGLVAPSQIGLDLDKKKNGDKNLLELKSELTPASPFGSSAPKGPSTKIDNTPKGIPQQGRPKNSKDTEKRQTKKFSPQTGASLNIWSLSAQEKISEILNPTFLEFYNKKNMRSLSNEQYDETEITKTKIFLSLKPFDTISEDMILTAFNNISNNKLANTYSRYKTFIKNLYNTINRELTAEELKFAKAYFYELVYFEE